VSSFGEPVVAWHAPDRPDRPLVVLLHGRGADENGIVGLAEHLPAGPSYAAVRAPITEGGGYAWFANRGIGRPLEASLSQTMTWFRQWLEKVAPAGRSVVLIGFSGGAAFAGGLLLSDPQRFHGAAILYGTLPFDAGVPTDAGRLAGVPVFVAQGDSDAVIPAELLSRTWTYLLGDSGAPTYAHRDPGGHSLTHDAVKQLQGWLAERLQFLAVRGSSESYPAAWTLANGQLPRRIGDRPDVSWTIPQEQRSDNSSHELQEQLFRRIAALPGVSTASSAISVQGARGFTLTPGATAAIDAFVAPHAGEFAHLHPDHDGSLHVALPPHLAKDAISKGWAVAHPLAGVRLAPGMVMLYGPRSALELEVIASVVEASYAFAGGASLHPLGPPDTNKRY
jgi:phospholipase/carboxylesterase